VTHAQLGTVPKDAAEERGRKAKVGIVRLDRIKEIEAETTTTSWPWYTP